MSFFAEKLSFVQQISPDREEEDGQVEGHMRVCGRIEQSKWMKVLTGTHSIQPITNRSNVVHSSPMAHKQQDRYIIHLPDPPKQTQSQNSTPQTPFPSLAYRQTISTSPLSPAILTHPSHNLTTHSNALHSTPPGEFFSPSNTSV